MDLNMISPIQEQFLLSYKLDPANSAYNLASFFQITGNLDFPVLEKTLISLSDHHNLPISRLTLEEQDIPFSTEVLMEAVNQPFNLEKAPPYRVHLWQGQDYSRLLFVFHHIIFDLRSKDIFGQDFSRVYNALKRGETPELKAAPCYQDYIKWYKKFSLTEKYKKMISWWEKEPLGNSLLSLPTDFKRPVRPSSKGTRIFGTIQDDISRRINHYCDREKSDPYLVLLTAYAVFLNRFSGQDTFNIGIPRTNRSKEDFQDIIGSFVNILPLCLHVEEDMTFKEILKQVRMKMLGMHRNQYIPYLNVVKLAKGKRDSKSSPLFQIGFTFEHPMRLELNGVECESVDVAPDAAQLDLFFYFWQEKDSFRWAIEYCTDLFTQQRVESYFNSFLNILDKVLDNNNLTVKTLPLIDTQSKKRIEEWNSTKRDYDFTGGIQDFFRLKATVQPDKTALIFRDESLSYGKLYEKAEILAHFLRKKGVEKETIVGLSLERSFEMVIGMYAIALAGGTYLPLEPTLPHDYTSFILEDSALSFILSKEAYRDSFPDTVDFIPLDNFDYSGRNHVQELPSVHSDDRVYILYTSGSTGRPKGVEITHRGLINRLLWMDEEYKLIEGDVLFQKTPYNFDVSGWEFWWPLMKGVPLVIAEPEGHRDNGYLINTIERENISLLHFVPSMLREFLKTCQSGNCSSLREVICSGEALPGVVVREFYEILPHCRLHNLYGPTEASIDVTYWPCTPDCRVVPIGRPIANTKVHILDDDLNLLPPGVTGEIYLAGTGLARGYLNKPGLTAEKFVPNPFDGGRMYKTGDLGQWNLQGDILYMGRNDSQVQLHGLRIELGEIENTLNDHPLVQAAAVVVHGEFGADQSLVAYVVKKEELSTEEITAFLGQHLPLHMIPQRIIFVRDLKLNSNGKLDRKRLPRLDSLPMSSSQTYICPQGERENMIAQLWKDMLELDKVGRDENFFEMGGTSLHIIQMQRELSEQLGRTIPVTDLFIHTTVKGLAGYLGEGDTSADDSVKLSQRADRSRNAAKRYKNIRKR